MDLDWYDYGARMYDPQIGRWHSVDPSAETYYSWTPYNYCANDPMNIVDLDGMDWYQANDEDGKVDKNGAVIWKEGNEKQNGYNNIGTTYTQTLEDGTTIKYDQNEPSEMTENVLNKGDWQTQRAKNGEPNDGQGNKVGDAGDCYYNSGKMVEKSGAKALDSNASGDFVDYINSQVDKGRSVRVHVDRNGEKGSNTGEHFVAISSRTTNLKTQEVTSFGFFDSGTSDQYKGTNNKFTVNSDRTLTGVNYSQKNYKVVKVKQSGE